MTLAQMAPAQQLAVAGTGVIFLVAMLTGVWTWRHMLNSATHLAPPYVDLAHRSALLYSFAGILVWQFAGWSVWSSAVNLLAVALLFAFFTIAIVTYIILGYRNQTDNQFKQRSFATTTGMYLLIAAEVGGFLILFSGTLAGA